jgi:hypothetical protein
MRVWPTWLLSPISCVFPRYGHVFIRVQVSQGSKGEAEAASTPIVPPTTVCWLNTVLFFPPSHAVAVVVVVPVRSWLRTAILVTAGVYVGLKVYRNWNDLPKIARRAGKSVVDFFNEHVKNPAACV